MRKPDLGRPPPLITQTFIAPEVERDYGRFTMELSQWEWHLDQLRGYVEDYDWSRRCIEALCILFDLDDAQQEHYFGEIYVE